jgi:pyruvate kinase
MTQTKSITKSKIICTLGPASSNAEMIKSLSDHGMDCARINFSHGTLETKKELFNLIREVVPELAILCDIQGPKIRIGKVKENIVTLVAGQKFIVTTDELEGDNQRVTISYKPLPKEIKPGELIYLNDGIICLQVEEINGNDIHTKVLSGGYISSRKGVNLPTTKISLKVPTPKDIEDLKLIAQLSPEYVAVSFVSDGNDISTIRNILTTHGNENTKIIAKIERPIAVDNFEEILEQSDGIMVARGDLGVELPPEQVLPVQKKIIRQANIVGKPVIVATQMLESMVKSPVPTRAETSDVFNAIEDGADAVMLSAETASGDFPLETVKIMERIIKVSEELIPRRNPDDYDSKKGAVSEIIGHLVYEACQEISDLKYQGGKILCLTSSGYTVSLISKYRPSLPILGITPNHNTAKIMRLIWGVEPIYLPEISTKNKIISNFKLAVIECLKRNLLQQDEFLIIVGNLLNSPFHTNLLSVVTVQEILTINI